MTIQIQKDKVLKLIAKRSDRTVKELKDSILEEGIDAIALREIRDITNVLKEQRIKDASSYEPTDHEIEAVLDGDE